MGVLSPYGTAGQAGNVYEREETDLDLVNDSSSSARGVRGGPWSSSSIVFISSSHRSNSGPAVDADTVGFRVASIPQRATLGDFNGDGLVDAADYVGWRSNDGSQAGYDSWRANFGRTATSIANSAVPEPMSALFVLVGTTFGRLRQRLKPISHP